MSALQVVDTEDTTGTQLPVSQTLMAHSVSQSPTLSTTPLRYSAPAEKGKIN